MKRITNLGLPVLLAVFLAACPGAPSDEDVYTVSGTITTNDPGGAASGASVQLERGGANVGNAASADGTGTYTIPGVPAGDAYTIEVSLGGYFMGTIPSFGVRGDVTGKDLRLVKITEPVYTVSGAITTNDPGGPASGASVQLKRGGANVGNAVSTGTDGSYIITGVPAGTGYAIEVSLSGYDTGTSALFNVTGNVTGKDLGLVKITEPVYTVSGTIATDDPGGAASGASVQLKRGGANVGNAASAGADGRYTITGVPAGAGYTIEVSLSGYIAGTIPSFEVTGNLTGKNLTLVRIIYTISGTITINDTGGPASGASVQLKQDGANVGNAASAGADGSYTITGVPVGDAYTIEVSLGGYTAGTIPLFEVRGDVTGKDLILSRAFYTVSGAIATENPGGVAGGASVQLKQDGVNMGNAVSADGTGAYTITGVPAGTGYTIEVSLSGYFTGTLSSFDVRGNVTGKNLTLVKIPTFNMVHVPGGHSFPTGTDDSGTATVANAYEIGETEVSYDLWYVVREWAESHGYTFYNNPGREGSWESSQNTRPWIHKQEPVTMVTWYDAVVWLNALTEWVNDRTGSALTRVYYYDNMYDTVAKDSTHTSNFVKENSSYSCPSAYAKPGTTGFRLPTSTEWELAARWRGNDTTNTVSGYTNPYCIKGNSASGATADYSDATETGKVAWYKNNANEGGILKTQAVKGKIPNGLGLYDMSGNVWEWCFDHPPTGSDRVRRGGSWYNDADFLQVGGVYTTSPDRWDINLGFRPARTAE